MKAFESDKNTLSGNSIPTSFYPLVYFSSKISFSGFDFGLVWFGSRKRDFIYLPIDWNNKNYLVTPKWACNTSKQKAFFPQRPSHLVRKTYSEVNKCLHNETNVCFNGKKKIDSNIEVP